MMLHVCTRDCFNAEKVFTRVLDWLITPGFFVSKNPEWKDVAFMSPAMATCIEMDEVLKKALPRVAENWKSKLRTKSPAIVLSLKSLERSYICPKQDSSVIVRQVACIII